MCREAQEVVYLRHLLTTLHFKQIEPAPMVEATMRGTLLAKNDNPYGKTKHVAGTDQHADLLTKDLDAIEHFS